jgi:hypothetical protein
MGIKAYDHQAITGLSNSGTTDNLGAWNVGFDVGAQLVDIPVGCPGLLIKTINTVSSNRWAGIRINGEASPEFLVDMGASQGRADFIKLKPGDIVDFYRESAEIEFRVLFALDSTWTLFDVASRPSLASSGGSFTTRTISECPENSTVITGAHRWRPIGEATNITNAPSGQQIIKLDGSKQYTAATTTTIPVIGYTTGTVNWRPWLADTLTYTADSTWRAASNEYADNRGAHLLSDKTGTALEFDFRSRGSAYASAAGNGPDENYFTDLNSLGQFDYLAESTLTAPVYIMATIPDVEVNAVTITSIDQFIAGEPFEITFSAPFSATSISATGGDVTVVIPVSGGAGIAPMWTATEECLKFGNVTITATDGVDTTDGFVQAYSIFDGYTAVELSSVSLTNYRAGTSPSLKVSSLVAYPPAITIDPDGGVDSGSTPGTYLIYDRDPDDFICRTYTLNYLVEPSSDDRGLTARGLTAVGPTATGLTAVGL